MYACCDVEETEERVRERRYKDRKRERERKSVHGKDRNEKEALSK